MKTKEQIEKARENYKSLIQNAVRIATAMATMTLEWVLNQPITGSGASAAELQTFLHAFEGDLS